MKNESKQTVSDEALVLEVITHDKEAYAQIVRRYQKPLLRYAEYLVHDPHFAADVVQASFIKAFEHLMSFDRKLSFSSWLYRIAHNEAMNCMRKHKHTVSMTDEFVQIPDQQLSVSDAYIRTELQNTVRHCLMHLSLMYREPISLYFLEEKTYQEISDILRLPINTVATRIGRAKRLLKDLCQKK